MRSALPLVALLALSALLPLASAQVPDPADAVAQACALAGDARDLLPMCPQEEPAAPQQAQEAAAQDAHDHGAQDAPQAAQDVAGEAQDAAGDVADDPTTAPDRVAALAATLLQFLKDLLSLPALGANAAWDGMAGVGAAVAGAASAAADAVSSGAQGAMDAVSSGAQAVGAAVSGGASYVGDLAAQGWDAVASLFGADAALPAGHDTAGLPAAKAPVDQAAGLLQQVVGALPAA
jgi:hypothetical protein